MNWNKAEIENEEGKMVFAQAPVIVSASRSTDIPTFYADWFVERWKKVTLNGLILLMVLLFMFRLKKLV
jgi:hypothetical protein